MDRREFVAALPAVLLNVRHIGSETDPFSPLGQVMSPASSDIQLAEILITFDNPYHGGPPTSVFSEPQKDQIKKAVGRWRDVWSTDEFKDKVQHAKFDATNDTGPMVYTKIMAANPKHANYALTAISKGSETAITNNKTGITRLQQSWLAGTTDTNFNRLVNTVAHEYTHTVEGGKYFHAHFQLVFGKNAVPLLVGQITEDIANKMFPQEKSV